MDVIDPSTGTQAETVEQHTEYDVTEAVNHLIETFGSFWTCPIRDCKHLLKPMAEISQDNKQGYAETITGV